MPHSRIDCKKEIIEFITSRHISGQSILDVGPGAGIYADMLSTSNIIIDGVEIYEPYIRTYKLDTKYRNIYLDDIRTFKFDHYDYIIMGDVLEHLSVKDAQQLLVRIKDKYTYLIVCIPFLYPQDEVGGNVHEKHFQPDLTHELFLDRYIGFKLLHKEKWTGAYYKERKT